MANTITARFFPSLILPRMHCSVYVASQTHIHINSSKPKYKIFASRMSHFSPENINNILRECELHMETFELNAHITKSKSCGDKTYVVLCILIYSIQVKERNNSGMNKGRNFTLRML